MDGKSFNRFRFGLGFEKNIRYLIIIQIVDG